MRFSLSTCWNAHRHACGESMVDEILGLGFDSIELGYGTQQHQVNGVLARIASGALAVDSVHAFCPVPVSAPHGYPELHLLASLDEDERAMASMFVKQTLDFAGMVGAKAVVLHAGRVFLKHWLPPRVDSHALLELLTSTSVAGNIHAPVYEKRLAKARALRATRAEAYMDAFCLSLDTILPVCERNHLTLALENLPSIEAFPDEEEMPLLKQRFPTSALRYWHDMGHGQLRENMGYCASHLAAAKALFPFTRGIHIHDAKGPDHDHQPIGEGMIDFDAFSFFCDDRIIKVFEPNRHTPASVLSTTLTSLRNRWQSVKRDTRAE